jgi:MoxR-like ATPase
MIKEAKAPKTTVVDMSMAAVKYNSRTGAAQYEIDPSYVMPPDGSIFCDVIDRARQKKSQNVMIVGPTGCGKTEFAKQFAARKGLSLLKMDCSNITEAEKWFGRLDIQAGSISWEETPFDRVVSEGNHVILLDEINRAAPEVLNVLLPLLDTSRSCLIQDRRPSPILQDGGGTVWFATMNQGAAYTGTTKLDRALRARFGDVVELTYLPKDAEVNLLIVRTGIDAESANKLVDIADTIRRKSKGIDSIFENTISTRELLNAAEKFLEGGASMLRFSMVNHFSGGTGADSERAQVLEMLKGKFGSLDGTDGKMATASDLINL